MWNKRWEELKNSQKVSGVLVCLLIGILLFAAGAALKAYLNPYSFTKSEYQDLCKTIRNDPDTDTYSLVGVSLSKDGEIFGERWTELTVLDTETTLRLKTRINAKTGPYQTALTLTDKDSDGDPDTAGLYVTGHIGKTDMYEEELGKVNKEVWNVWIVRFLENVK
jgi:hypothetical protein